MARLDANSSEAMKKTALVLLALALSGCAAKSNIRPVAGAIPLARHAEPVCLLKSPLPSAYAYKVIGKVNSSKKTYGSVNELLPLIAADARAVGADAIINLVTGQKMGAFAWARPVATGTAVKLADPAAFNCVANGGELR